MLTRLFHTVGYLLKKYVATCVVLLFIFLVCGCFTAKAQYFDLEGSKKHVTIPFKVIREMIVIQLIINNKGPFNFILDTGVGLMLITDPKLVDSINISNKRTIKISSLGEGEDYEAYITSALKIHIPGLVSYDIGAAILKKDHFGLSNYAGIPIHGLLGYEFFNNLAVKIDFADSTLSVSRPKDVRLFKKGTKIPISIQDRKPYINARVIFPNGTKINEKLIVDLGAGHPLSIENIINMQGLPQKFIAANLGVGLTGPINGFLSRVDEVDIGKFKFKDVITSFPVLDKAVIGTKRDGNLGIGLLKRFTVIFDFTDSVIYLKPNFHFNDPFEHDMSGLEYYGSGNAYNRVIISRVEPGSPADEVGLEKDDEIVAINFKPVSEMSLEQIDAIFRSKTDRSLLLEVFHDRQVDNVIITLKRRI
ncbi:MAG: hypothetical protein JWP45_3570 [Mucilaginibacter sp.]|nr:hypothetical protein [Mucilaginibacter sp.]